MILGTELTLHWNGIEGVYSLNSTGQLIPMLVRAAAAAAAAAAAVLCLKFVQPQLAGGRCKGCVPPCRACVSSAGKTGAVAANLWACHGKQAVPRCLQPQFPCAQQAQAGERNFACCAWQTLASLPAPSSPGRHWRRDPGCLLLVGAAPRLQGRLDRPCASQASEPARRQRAARRVHDGIAGSLAWRRGHARAIQSLMPQALSWVYASAAAACTTTGKPRTTWAALHNLGRLHAPPTVLLLRKHFGTPEVWKHDHTRREPRAARHRAGGLTEPAACANYLPYRSCCGAGSCCLDGFCFSRALYACPKAS